LHAVIAEGHSVDAWWKGLDRRFWGRDLASAFSHADRALANAGLEGVRLDLLLVAELELPEEVDQLLRLARQERHADAVGSLALQRLLAELNVVLAKAEEVCAW
jgi:hypothetical protein